LRRNLGELASGRGVHAGPRWEGDEP
jgi:hypothetical protein